MSNSEVETDRQPSQTYDTTSADITQIVRPHHVMRNIFNPRTLLVIAAEGCLRVPDDLKTFTEGENGVLVRLTKSLPLEKQPSSPIDAIALVCKVFNLDSLKAIKDSLPFIDVRYFVGKCFILATSDEHFGPSDMEDINKFASQHHLPIYYAPKVKVSEKRYPVLQIPSNLLSIYCPRKPCDVNSLIVDAVIQY